MGAGTTVALVNALGDGKECIMSRASLVGIFSALLCACGGEPGTKPHDASAAQHQAMAEREERTAEEHEGAQKQAAGAHASQDEVPGAKGRQPCGRGGCWTSSTSPTEQNEQDAERHRELAAKHRAASSALVTAEQQACAGLSEDDRDISPFYHREDIASVTVIEEPVRLGKQTGKRTAGAKIVFLAVPGMTAEWLQRVVDCHIARAAAAGHIMPEMDYCPLVPKDVKAKVRSVGNGFAVDVTSDDSATVKEIIRRAERLR